MDTIPLVFTELYVKMSSSSIVLYAISHHALPLSSITLTILSPSPSHAPTQPRRALPSLPQWSPTSPPDASLIPPLDALPHLLLILQSKTDRLIPSKIEINQAAMPNFCFSTIDFNAEMI